MSCNLLVLLRGDVKNEIISFLNLFFFLLHLAERVSCNLLMFIDLLTKACVFSCISFQVLRSKQVLRSILMFFEFLAMSLYSFLIVFCIFSASKISATLLVLTMLYQLSCLVMRRLNVGNAFVFCKRIVNEFQNIVIHIEFDSI